MATIWQNPNFPHILGMAGTDVVSDGGIVINVINNIFSDTNPLGNLEGKVDFIICFVLNGNGVFATGADFSYYQAGVSRPLRAIIQITFNRIRNYLLNPTPQITGGLLGAKFAHEVGHHWLIPRDAKIRSGGQEVKIPTSKDIWKDLLDGKDMPEFPIMGRQHSHWGIYLDGENSPMDSVNHDLLHQSLSESEYSQVSIRGSSGPVINLPGEAPLPSGFQYSPLDLHIMGLSPPSSTFHVLKPRWVYPLSFQSGLYFELDNGQSWYFGFDRGPHRIWGETTDGTINIGSRINLDSPFDPNERVGLRIHQDNNQVHMQVRFWKSVLSTGLGGCLYAILTKLGIIPIVRPKPKRQPPIIGCKTIMGDFASKTVDPSTDPYLGWKTVLTVPTEPDTPWRLRAWICRTVGKMPPRANVAGSMTSRLTANCTTNQPSGDGLQLKYTWARMSGSLSNAKAVA